MKLRFGRPKMSRCSAKSWPAVKWLGSFYRPLLDRDDVVARHPIPEKSSTRSAPLVEKIAGRRRRRASPVPLMLNS